MSRRRFEIFRGLRPWNWVIGGTPLRVSSKRIRCVAGYARPGEHELALSAAGHVVSHGRCVSLRGEWLVPPGQARSWLGARGAPTCLAQADPRRLTPLRARSSPPPPALLRAGSARHGTPAWGSQSVSGWLAALGGSHRQHPHAMQSAARLVLAHPRVPCKRHHALSPGSGRIAPLCDPASAQICCVTRRGCKGGSLLTEL